MRRRSASPVGSALAALVLFLPLPAQAAAPDVSVLVDPRVELMSIVFRLAGNPEYNRPRVPAYAAAVDAHFAAHKEHAAVRMARRLRQTRGISYDAVMALAVHVQDASALAEAVPLDPRPVSLDARWRPDEARAFLTELRRFVKDTDFAAFFARHEELHAAAVSRMEKVLAQDARLDWIEGFFGVPPKARFQLALGMLNGGACYGPRVMHPDGSEDIHCVLGVWLVDPAGAPRFDETVLPTVVHEFCHSYCNPLVDAHAAALAPVGKRLWPAVAEQMKRQAYASWKTMMYESLVRASVVRYMGAAQGAAGLRKQAAEEKSRGFLWIDELAALLGTYEEEREKYKTLDAFMPRIVTVLEAYATEMERNDAARPRVVSMTPANGATDVDPNQSEIQVTFDRPMRDGGWAFVGGGPHFPEVKGKPSYDKSRRVLTLPVALKPDWPYEFWLNRGRFASFQSAEGVPLRSVHVTFRTRKGD